MSLDMSPWVRSAADAATVARLRDLSNDGRLYLARSPRGPFTAKWIRDGALRGEARDTDLLTAAVRAIRGDGVPPSVVSADAMTGTE